MSDQLVTDPKDPNWGLPAAAAPAAVVTDPKDPNWGLPTSTPAAGGAMNFAIVNGQRVPIDEATPHDPWQHAETIGAPKIGDRLVDKPLTTMNVLDVVRRFLFGANAERPATVQREDPFGTQAFAEGKGSMPILPLPEAEVGQTFKGFIEGITKNRRHMVGRELLSDALNIKKAGVITEPEFDTALARIGVTHRPDNPIQFLDEIAQRSREVSHDMDNHVRGIANQFPHVDIQTSPLRDIATAGAANPIGGGGPGSSFVQQGRGQVLRLYPQLGHYEPILNSQGKQIGSRLVDDPVSIPTAAEILTSINKQLNDRLGPQAARRVRTDMLATDPAYAALDATAKALRKGIDEALEGQGVPGVRAFRHDQAAVIKLQQAAEKVEGKGWQKMTRTSAPSAARQVAGDVIPSIATAAGATQGPAGALVGKTVGESIKARLLPSLTRDQAVAKAYRLMKTPPQLSFPMMPSHVQGAAAGARPAPNAAAGSPGGGQGGAGGGGGLQRTPGPSVTSWPIVPATGLSEAPTPAGLPPLPPNQIGPGARFVVRPTGQVQKTANVRPGALVNPDAVWPRPAMTETYQAPKNDPSFVRAVKGTYAEVFKRAEPAAAAGREPLPAPEASGPRRGRGVGESAAQRDVARARFREDRAAIRADDKRILDETLDTLTQRYVDAGHPDPPAAIRAKLVEDLRGINELYLDAAAEEGGGSALLKAIAKYGGISVKAEGAQKAEIEWLKELRDGDVLGGVRGVFRDLARGGADAKRMNMQRQVMGKGARKIPYGGLSLDEMLTSLRQDPQFQGLNTINDLTAAIEKAARADHPTAAERKGKALADLVYHTERDIAGHQGPDVDDGFAAFADAVDEIVKPKDKR